MNTSCPALTACLREYAGETRDRKSVRAHQEPPIVTLPDPLILLPFAEDGVSLGEVSQVAENPCRDRGGYYHVSRELAVAPLGTELA